MDNEHGVSILTPENGWFLAATSPEYDADTEYNVKSMKRLREMYYGAKWDDELFQFMCNPDTREQLRAVLIHTYFTDEVKSILVEHGRVNQEAYEYSKQLMLLLQDPQGEFREESETKQKARDQGFRKTIVNLYEHRCALCGVRMLTPEGHTVVEAAHIKPWHNSYDGRADPPLFFRSYFQRNEYHRNYQRAICFRRCIAGGAVLHLQFPLCRYCSYDWNRNSHNPLFHLLPSGGKGLQFLYSFPGNDSHQPGRCRDFLRYRICREATLRIGNIGNIGKNRIHG